MKRPRLRDMDITVGSLPTGKYNAITDVAGVLVGHETLVRGEGPLKTGLGPVRSGVTVILPHDGNLFCRKVRAAVHTINGFGKTLGFEEVRELGVLESPVALTGTLNVGLVADALVEYSLDRNPSIGLETHCVNVVVGETNDGYLNDAHGRHVRSEHVLRAIASARAGRVAEGSVGAGTGNGCFGWKGGIGTASRVLPETQGGFRTGVLVQSNLISRPRNLVVAGAPVGRHVKPPDYEQPRREPGGSIVIVIATDAPLTSRQLQRLCVRAGVGLARTGSNWEHGSGDFVIGFSTAEIIEHRPAALITSCRRLADEGRVLQGLFQAVAESVEEAVLNSMFRAGTMVGRDGNTRYGLPVDRAAAIVHKYAGAFGSPQ